MIKQVQKVRIYPTNEQQVQLAKAMGCCQFGWNYALQKTIETYQQTGKNLSRSALNALLPDLKKENEWLKTDQRKPSHCGRKPQCERNGA